MGVTTRQHNTGCHHADVFSEWLDRDDSSSSLPYEVVTHLIGTQVDRRFPDYAAHVTVPITRRGNPWSASEWAEGFRDPANVPGIVRVGVTHTCR